MRASLRKGVLSLFLSSSMCDAIKRWETRVMGRLGYVILGKRKLQNSSQKLKKYAKHTLHGCDAVVDCVCLNCIFNEFSLINCNVQGFTVELCTVCLHFTFISLFYRPYRAKKGLWQKTFGVSNSSIVIQYQIQGSSLELLLLVYYSLFSPAVSARKGEQKFCDKNGSKCKKRNSSTVKPCIFDEASFSRPMYNGPKEKWFQA